MAYSFKEVSDGEQAAKHWAKRNRGWEVMRNAKKVEIGEILQHRTARPVDHRQMTISLS